MTVCIQIWLAKTNFLHMATIIVIALTAIGVSTNSKLSRWHIYCIAFFGVFFIFCDIAVIMLEVFGPVNYIRRVLVSIQLVNCC